MVSKTPRRNENDYSTPMAQVFEDVDGEDNKTNEADRVAELEAALKELREKSDREREEALYTQPSQWQSQVTEQQPTYIDPKTITLPDPALDPDGYANAVQRRAELTMENAQHKNERAKKFENDIDDKTKALWEDFEYEYPDYAGDREKIDFVATSVVKAAVKKNIDINRYMFGAGRSRFMKDVAKKYETVFGEPEAEDDYEDTRRSNRTEARTARRTNTSTRSRSEDDEGRSAGVFGGNEGSGRTNRRNVDADTGPSMIDDLQGIQKKSGFF